jgi:hypothetical protein
MLKWEGEGAGAGIFDLLRRDGWKVDAAVGSECKCGWASQNKGQ